MHNPFTEIPYEVPDEQLVTQGQQGNREALETLALRHQTWIYNLAVRMVWSTDEAQDLTQDILLKMIASLAGFRSESRFRTWLYRIAINHIYTHKKQKADEPVLTFAEFSKDLDETPNIEIPVPHDQETMLLIEEAKYECTIAMLQCLDGRQRLVYILGEIFGATDTIGAEVLSITPDNFRQILARARKDLYSYMNGRCGLVNESNPCRCAKKTRGFIQQGYINPNRLQFAEGYQRRIRQVAPSRTEELETITDQLHAALFREHPFLDVREKTEMVRRALKKLNFEPPQ